MDLFAPFQADHWQDHGARDGDHSLIAPDGTRIMLRPMTHTYKETPFEFPLKNIDHKVPVWYMYSHTDVHNTADTQYLGLIRRTTEAAIDDLGQCADRRAARSVIALELERGALMHGVPPGTWWYYGRTHRWHAVQGLDWAPVPYMPPQLMPLIEASCFEQNEGLWAEALGNPAIHITVPATRHGALERLAQLLS